MEFIVDRAEERADIRDTSAPPGRVGRARLTVAIFIVSSLSNSAAIWEINSIKYQEMSLGSIAVAVELIVSSFQPN